MGGELLEELIIPEGITQIKPFTFKRFNCRKAIIGNDVTTIWPCAFYQSEIDEIIFGDKVKEVSSLSSKVKSITFQTSLEKVPHGLFCNSGLEQVHVPSLDVWLDMGFYVNDSVDGYEYFEGWYFNHPYSLYVNGKHVEDLVIPKGVEEIRPLNFEYADIKSVSFPSSLKEIGRAAFRNSGLESLTLPEGILARTSAFRYCGSLRDIELQDKYYSNSSNYLFANCENLSTVRFADICNVRSAGMFRGCSSLQELTVPEGTLNIPFDFLVYCKSLEKVSFPSTLESVDADSFGECQGLKSIVFKCQIPPYKGLVELGPIFYDVDLERLMEDCTLYVPQGTYESYRESPEWGEFENIVEMDMSTESLINQ